MSTATRECRVCGVDVKPCVCGSYSFTPGICPTCVDAEAGVDKQLVFEHRMREMGIRRLWWDLGFEDFKSEAGLPVLSECVKYVEGWPQTEGLVIYSAGKGNGKTLLAASILKGVGDGFFVNCAEMLVAIRLSYDDGSPTDVLAKCRVAPLLVIDDMGAHKTTDWVQEQLYVLLNYRIEEILPTIITTKAEDFSRVFGERIGSRVFGHCRVLTLKGGDYRREKHEKEEP